MSRFFRNVSDSESDSDSSSTDSYFSDSDATHSSEDESEDERVSTPTAKGGSNWFMKGASDSDSEDEVKRVVKSAKDKRIEELEASYKTIENALKINDWAAVSNEYEKMLKVITKINANSEKIPSSYLQILITIEDAFGEIKDKKKLNSVNAKALNVLKQKVKKNNKLYEKRIEALRNGQEEEEEETPVELPTKTK
jgi:translation initiation factor 3 subunit C